MITNVGRLAQLRWRVARRYVDLRMCVSQVQVTMTRRQACAVVAVLDCVGGVGKARMIIDGVRNEITEKLGLVAFGEYYQAAERRVSYRPPLYTSWKSEHAVQIYDANENGYTVPPEPGDWGYPAYAREMARRVEEKFSGMTPKMLAAVAWLEEEERRIHKMLVEGKRG